MSGRLPVGRGAHDLGKQVDLHDFDTFYPGTR